MIDYRFRLLQSSQSMELRCPNRFLSCSGACRTSGWSQVETARRQAPPPLLCPCSNQHVIDTHGDHIHTLARSTLAARRMPTRRSWMHRTRSVITRACPHIATTYPRCARPTARPSRASSGDLFIKDVNLGGTRNVIVDVAFIHELCSTHRADVSRKGQLRCQQIPRDRGAHPKVVQYRDAYANRHGNTYAFPASSLSWAGYMGSSCASSTSLPTGAPNGTSR